jgi:tRNA (guanine37-N1)-methyltransferase
MRWRAHVLTLFPAMLPGPLGHSLAGKALADGVWQLQAHDIREHGVGRHRQVDDTPAGGGPGMVLRVDVLAAAIDAAIEADPGLPALAMTPRGRPVTQARVRDLAAGPGVILLCGRFEGFDERIFAARPVEPVSLADIVLSGGELAAMALIDACVRLLPGVMGAAESAAEESFGAGGGLEYPHYTRPQSFEGLDIPDILRSGDHAAVARWRAATAHADTLARRPDLLAGPASAPTGEKR